MAYIAEYERPYEGGYVDLPSETTPEMAEFINARDDAIIKIEEFLADLDIGSLGGDYALVSEAGYSLDVSMNNDYVLTLSLKNKDGNNLSSKSIDLPIESMIVDVDYTEGKLVLTLQNGNTVDVDVSDMVRGLVPTSRTIAGLDLSDDITKEELKDAIGIYDDTVTAGEIKPWLYDTSGEEVIIGVFGGKPLYRKIFHVDVTTSNQSAEIRLSDVLDNFSQIENIVDYVVYTAANNRLPIVYVSSQFQGSSAMAFVSVRDDVIRINHGTAISFTNARFRVVLEYTKTTDGAGSGNNLNPYGIYSATLEDVKADIEKANSDIEKLQNAIVTTDSTTLSNSHEGRLLVEEIGGVCEQGANPSPSNPQEIKKSVIGEIRTHDGNGNETVVTLSQPIELYGMGDVKDFLTSKQTKRKYVKRVFDGSEEWMASSSFVGRYYINNIGCKAYGNVLCSHARGNVGTEIINTCYLREQDNGRFVINAEFSDLDEWKAHLAENPMTVVYELATPITEELPIADQIALNSVKTFDGITYLEFDSEIEPTFKGEYGTSKIGGMTIESLLTAQNNDLRLSSLEAIVVNNI